MAKEGKRFFTVAHIPGQHVYLNLEPVAILPNDGVVPAGSQEWRSTDHVSNTSWVLLDRADPVLHCDVRVLARNQVGDTATSSILRFSGPAPGKGK